MALIPPTKGELYEVTAILIQKFYPNNQSIKLIDETIEYAQKIWDRVEHKHALPWPFTEEENK
jgi:hypothetical protein